MSRTRNILFVMSDQLRFDYLSCMGHPTLETPHIDALAARGVLFTHAWCNDPVCGPSRMSFYTGRYAFSHGATYNNFPLRADEMTLGDYLRPLGLRTAVVGKTHMQANLAGMRRLGIDPASPQGILIGECGFEPFERDDGLHPNEALDPGLRYNRYLRGLGYESPNPWHDFANSAEGKDGSVLSGWNMRHASRPARVAEEHSETAYMTDRAMEFIESAGDEPWCLHLSYIKPHWPYMAPAPYHDMFGPDAVPDPVRDESERTDPNPVVAAFMAHSESAAFARDEVRTTVIPAYMGLVKQLDDHIGRLMGFLSERGLLDDTMIVFTSDHGDYLGDHWLGEKELFHEQSVRIPLIVCRSRCASGRHEGLASGHPGRVDRPDPHLPRRPRRGNPVGTAGGAIADAGDPGNGRGGMARRGVRRVRFLGASGPASARHRAAGSARVHGAHGGLEVRRMALRAAAALRSA